MNYPVLWMLTILGSCLSRHTEPYSSFNVTLSSKSLLPEEKEENATHSSTMGKSSEGSTLPSAVNGKYVNTMEVHDVTPEASSEFEARKSTQTRDQWPPPKQNDDVLHTTPTQMQKVPTTSRDARKLAKDIYTRLAANDDVVALPPVKDKTSQLGTHKTEKPEGRAPLEENKTLTPTSDPYSEESSEFFTPSREDPVIAANKVLVTSKHPLIGNYRESNSNGSGQKNISLDHPVTDSFFITDEVESSFLQDDHQVQKLSLQEESDHRVSESLEVYSPGERLPFHKGETEVDSVVTESKADEITKAKLEKDLTNGSQLNLSEKGAVISALEKARDEDNSHENTSVFSITNEKKIFTVSGREIISLSTSAPESSMDITAILTERNETDTETEGSRVSFGMPSMNVSLTKGYKLKYVDIKDKPTISTSSSTPMTSKIQNSATVLPSKQGETQSVTDKWKDLERKIRAQSSSLLKKVLPRILEHSGRSNVSSKCAKAMIQLIGGLRSLKSWAVKMVDSSGKIPSGSLEGTLTDFGDYDECLKIQKPSRRKDEIRGQYCAVQLRPILPPLTRSITFHSKILDFGNTSKETIFADLSDASALLHIMTLRTGLCVPSPCSSYDVDQLMSMVFQGLPLEVSVPWCKVKQPVKFSSTQIVIISLMALLGLFICVGTASDVFLRRWSAKGSESGRLKQSLCAFSLVSNVKQLVQNSSQSGRLGAVNGIRCLSLAWIILAHTYGFGHRQGLARLTDAKRNMEDIAFQIITNAWLSVDTFFMLGGLLVANSTFKAMERTGGKINFVHHALHRIWRLTPPVVAVVGIMFLLPLIGSGPLWPDMVEKKVANCERRWWSAILPLNSWFDFDSACLLHTWYISADIQFYCLAPIALIAFYRWPTLGYVVVLVATSACSLVTGLLTIFYYLPPTVIFFSPNIEMTLKTANLVYFRPYPHMGAYCVGLVLGYILWKYQKITVNWMLQILGWCMSITSCLTVLFATYPWSKGQMPGPAAGVAYAVVHRTVWAAGIAWLLFMCITKRAGILDKFLSWSFFTPLSRLCYSVYLLHFPVLWVRVGWRRTLLNFHHYDIVTEFFGILAVSLCLSVFLHLIFEVPFLNLESIWFPRSHEKKKNMEIKQKTLTV